MSADRYIVEARIEEIARIAGVAVADVERTLTKLAESGTAIVERRGDLVRVDFGPAVAEILRNRGAGHA